MKGKAKEEEPIGERSGDGSDEVNNNEGEKESNDFLEGLGKMYQDKNVLMALLKNVAPMWLMRKVMRVAEGRIDIDATSSGDYVPPLSSTTHHNTPHHFHSQGYSALIFAIEMGGDGNNGFHLDIDALRMEAVAWVLDLGADSNKPTAGNVAWTPLMFAVYWRDMQMMNLLLKAGISYSLSHSLSLTLL